MMNTFDRVLAPTIRILLLFLATTVNAHTKDDVEHSFLRRVDKTRSSNHHLTVMTRNVYVGTDFTPVLLATNAQEFAFGLQESFFQAIGDLGQTSFGSNPWLRMDAVAGEIADSGATLVGLQEVAVYTVNGTVVADFAELILDGLKNRSMVYEKVVDKTGFQFSAPLGNITAGFQFGDVILARTDLPDELQVHVSNPQSGYYNESVTVPSPSGEGLPFPRQWVSVDAKITNEPTLRFVSTHLEALNPLARAAQATELVTSPKSPLQTTLDPIILVGDFNAQVAVEEAPNVTDAADIVLQAGFTDVWQKVGDGPGNTFGHDAKLADPSQELFEYRIDYIMYRGEEQVVAKEAVVVDTKISEDTPPLWPSDHGGVVGVMEIMSTDEAMDATSDGFILETALTLHSVCVAIVAIVTAIF